MAPRVRPLKCLLPEIMRDRGLEPQDVYDHPDIKMSKQQFSAYYTGRKTMSIPTARVFGRFFGIPIDDLYLWPPDSINRWE